MKIDTILSNYLSENGVVHDLGSNVTEIDEENIAIDKSDTEVFEKLKLGNEKSDFLLLAMYIILIAVAAVIISKMLIDIKNNYTILTCIGTLIIILAIMHRIWRDKVRSSQLLKILPSLEKKDRLKLVLLVLRDSREYNLNIKSAFSWLTSMRNRI
ncbi:hypothetical protein ACFFLS_11915 [Flavobacterium procerum]|uniref:Uncharacterized protein n=1 Tax=Flavobacterium procerum TaxID=1455569 RepID=A0ABV6BQP3_9FLAO